MDYSPNFTPFPIVMVGLGVFCLEVAEVRYVKTNISFTRFVLGVCHETDWTIRFDVTGMDRETVLKRVARYMQFNQPNKPYTITRPANRPGYCDVHFTHDGETHAKRTYR
jgi:hypothetical protein